MARRLLALCCLLLAAVFVAVSCSDGDGSEASAPTTEPTTDAAPPTPEPTEDRAQPATVVFSEDVLPVIESVCARCHTENGPGTAHLRMDTVGDVAGASQAIAAAVGVAIMPPWPASDASVPFVDNWSLPVEHREAIVAWATGGGGVDLDASRTIVSTAGVERLTDADLVIVPDVGYDGDAGQPDEYRCFVYDPGFTEDTWISGYEFVPDQTEVVHHAIGYLVDGGRRDRAVELEQEDPANGGWSCFGGSRLGQDDIFLGWAPGQRPTLFPDGSGLRVGADDFIVLQVHYHFEVDAAEDASALHLELADPGDAALDDVTVLELVAPAEIPCSTDEVGPLCDRDAALARAIDRYGREGVLADGILGVCGQRAADFAAMTNGLATASCDHRVGVAGELISVLGHEHEIGASFRMTLNPGTDEEVVLLDIPTWDFDWQFNYQLVETIDLVPSDVVRVECAWDRSLRDPELEPAYVLWADGTDDEMCFATMSVRVAAAPDPDDDAILPVGLFDAEITACVTSSPAAATGGPDAVAAALLECGDAAVIGERVAAFVVAEGAGGFLVDADTSACLAVQYQALRPLAGLLSLEAGGRDSEAFYAVAEPFGACVPAGNALQRLLPNVAFAEASISCLNTDGAELVEVLVVESIGGPGLTAIPQALVDCLTPEELSAVLGAA